MKSIDSGGLFEELQKKHYVYPPASKAALDRLVKLHLPSDLLSFYAKADGACMHRSSDSGGLILRGGKWWKWELMPSEKFVRVAKLGIIHPDSPKFSLSAQWIEVVNVQDGNYLAVNTEKDHVGEILDCEHATLAEEGRTFVVTDSFSRMLQLLIASPEPFWLKHSHRKAAKY